MLSIHHANQLEDLADQLAANLKHAKGSVLAPEIVAVPGMAVSEWLTVRLASQFGISANMQWLLPARLLWKIFRDALPEVPNSNAFSADVLSWRVLTELQDRDWVDDHPALRRYLGQADARGCWQLARQMGRLYEQYLIFRPDWISTWEAGRVEEWQGALWHRLIQHGDQRHWLRLRGALFEQLRMNPEQAQALPKRISLFALAGLSPAFLKLVAELAEHTAIDVYHLNFSQGFWADIVSDRERAHLVASKGEALEDYLERGHQLLASMGRIGRQHLSQLMELETDESEHYRVPRRSNLLHTIQADIVELRDSSVSAPFSPDPSDRSIELHVCHGPMREVEVLHNQLLDAFAQDPDLSPADVRVYVPKLADYAASIAAVFGSATGPRYIPWALAENALHRESPLTRTFLALLELPLTRLDAQRLGTLLDSPMVRRRFGLSEIDVDQISEWIRRLGIVWGTDAETLRTLHFDIGAVHTWRGGSDRLLLGFALGDTGLAFEGVLPVASGDTGLAQVAGRWRSFLEEVIRLQSVLSRPNSLPDWTRIFNDILDRFFVVDSEESDSLTRLRQQFADLARDGLVAGWEGEIPLSVVIDALSTKLNGTSGGRFMSGAVTFASLAHGRCLPARRVYLIGMNAGDFPGRENSHGLDLMLLNPRATDRSRRDEDRFAFLEALMSARSGLSLSYSGANLRDESVQPPSIVIDELVEEINTVTAGKLRAQDLTVRHPLQPFSRRYFEGNSRLFSYSKELIPGGDASPAARPLLAQSLPPPPPGELAIEDLLNFFANPARALLRGQLGVSLESGDGLFAIREPMWPDYRALRDLSRSAVNAQLVGEDQDIFKQRLRLGGALAAGHAGDIVIERAWARAAEVAKRVSEMTENQPAETLPIECEIGHWRLSGTLSYSSQYGHVRWFVADLNPWELIDAWLAHLLLNTVPALSVRESVLIGPTGVSRFEPVDKALELLAGLINVYQQGLSRPLPFFPRSAYTFVTKQTSPLKYAYETWLGSEFNPARPEADDPYFALTFRDTLETALDEEFQSIAQAVYAPALASLTGAKP